MRKGRYTVLKLWGAGGMNRMGKASSVRRARKLAEREACRFGSGSRAYCVIVRSKDIHGPEVADCDREMRRARAYRYDQEQLTIARGW